MTNPAIIRPEPGRDGTKYCQLQQFSWAFFAVILLLWSACPAAAQSRTASIRGTLRDSDGAAIPSVVVSAVHVGTGTHYTGTSNAAGEFAITDLAAGTYGVSAMLPDFTQIQRLIDLVEGQTATLDWPAGPDPKPADQEVTKKAGVKNDAEAASSAGQITESQLAGLPLNGRSYSQLATLQTGVSDPFAGSAARGGGSGGLTVSGGRSTSNNFLLDGTNIMDAENQVPQSAAGVQLGSDAVFQVQVFAANYSAEYGRGSGGVLNSISRSGTPQIHGTLFEYFRNSKLDARNFFDADANPPPFKRNQFGFTLTGPLVKDRTYWMGSFESLRDRLNQSNVDIFPDLLTRQGIITDIGGQIIQTIPVLPAVVPYLALYPIPNKGSLGRGLGEYVTTQFLPTSETFFTVRLDHKLSEHTGLFARYTFDDAVSDAAQDSVFYQDRTLSRQQYLTLVGSHVFSPNLLASFRFGYTRPVGIVDLVANVAVPPSLFFVPGVNQPGLISVSGLGAWGNQSNFPEAKIPNTFQWVGDVLAQRGPHALKLGMEVHRYRWDVSSEVTTGGNWFFNSLESFLRGGSSGTSMSVALLGASDRKAYRQTLLGWYFQDTFKMSSRLQWTLGLRYEFATLIHDRDGKTSFVPDPLKDREMQVGLLLASNPSLRNFSPRVGFSWSPFARANTIVSGGFGIYYDQLIEYMVDRQKSTAPFFPIVINNNFDSSSTFPNAIAAAAGIPQQARFLDYHNFSNPMVMRYHFAIQQQLPGGLNLRSSYVGARGNHLLRSYELNQFPIPIVRADGSICFPPDETQQPVVNPACPPQPPDRAGARNPAFGAMSVVSSDAQAFYNSLQLSASFNPGRGSSAQVGYTFSKSIDDATSAEIRNVGANQQYGFRRTIDRGLSDFDIRHRLSVNYFYSLPLANGPGWLAPLLGGWRIGGIFSLRTGTPFSPTVSIRARGYLFSPSRPNLIPGRSNNPKVGTVEKYFDPTAFSVPELGTIGNLGRNTVIAPSIVNADISIQRNFALDSKRQLQFRVDIFNIANHPNFNKPSGAATSVVSGTPTTPTGGNLITSSAAGRLSSTVTTARQIQFALRLSF